MRATVTWDETWQRSTTIEVDEAEVREWAGLEPDATIPGRTIKEFIEADRDYVDAKTSLGFYGHPGGSPDDTCIESTIRTVTPL